MFHRTCFIVFNIGNIWWWEEQRLGTHYWSKKKKNSNFDDDTSSAVCGLAVCDEEEEEILDAQTEPPVGIYNLLPKIINYCRLIIDPLTSSRSCKFWKWGKSVKYSCFFQAYSKRCLFSRKWNEKKICFNDLSHLRAKFEHVELAWQWEKCRERKIKIHKFYATKTLYEFFTRDIPIIACWVIWNEPHGGDLRSVRMCCMQNYGKNKLNLSF